MRIIIHRGNQIGGCITEIVSSKGTRIFVDLGHNLPQGDEESEDEYASEEAVANLIDDARAVFFTHMHGDHVELFKYVPDGVDQYIGPLALKIMEAKYKHMFYAPDLKENSLKCLKKLEPFKTYRKGHPIAIDDISVTPFWISHSSADSYMLKIQCDGKTILHTGDFRGHGYMGEGIFRVIDQYHIAGHVDILIPALYATIHLVVAAEYVTIFLVVALSIILQSDAVRHVVYIIIIHVLPAYQNADHALL